MFPPDQLASQEFVRYVIPLDSILGDDEEDTALLVEMSKASEHYLRSRTWCIYIKEGLFADGYGGIIAAFLYKVTIKDVKEDEWVWVIVGNVPSVYLETEGFPTPHSAISRYLDGLEEWISAVQNGQTLKDLIPIDTSPSVENIRLLQSRIKTLRESILPHISALPAR